MGDEHLSKNLNDGELAAPIAPTRDLIDSKEPDVGASQTLDLEFVDC